MKLKELLKEMDILFIVETMERLTYKEVQLF